MDAADAGRLTKSKTKTFFEFFHFLCFWWLSSVHNTKCLFLFLFVFVFVCVVVFCCVVVVVFGVVVVFAVTAAGVAAADIVVVAHNSTGLPVQQTISEIATKNKIEKKK